MSISNGLAMTPPLGWNSWDCYGTTVREQEVKANADFMAARLAQFGWNYVVVDIQWYEPNAQAHGYRPNAELITDGFGRLLPALNRFPSAANGAGFKPLADYVHSLGLRFGIHIMRGIPRQAVNQNLPVFNAPFHAQDIADTSSLCPWNTDMYGLDMSKPGAQAYYDSIVALYASWEVDYIKADDMLYPYHADEIAALHQALQHCGREIILSLSPGVELTTDRYEHLRQHCELFRISGDFWDRWDDLKNQFATCNTWADFTEPGCWADADMLPLGHIGIRAERGMDRQSLLTHDEQITLMTLWVIVVPHSCSAAICRPAKILSSACSPMPMYFRCSAPAAKTINGFATRIRSPGLPKAANQKIAISPCSISAKSLLRWSLISPRSALAIVMPSAICGRRATSAT